MNKVYLKGDAPIWFWNYRIPQTHEEENLLIEEGWILSDWPEAPYLMGKDTNLTNCWQHGEYNDLV